MKTDFHERIVALDDGAYDVLYSQRRYLLRKETHLGGRLIKLYAEELGSNDFVSLNYYPEKGLLKPCEMAPEKVITFIERMELI